ncbi:hypothetical protein MMC19_000240 [Ptychographa xylographoides]|nr:hypothetical protein [Ptychographa xylographoides]
MSRSLWLAPSPDSQIYHRIAELIKSLPEAHPSLRSSPQFTPHITLTSHITEKNPNLSTLEIPDDLRVSIKDLSFGGAYFKKIYFTMEWSQDLINLAKEVRMKLGGMGEHDAQREVSDEYDPHVSLVYNDVALSSDMEASIGEVVMQSAGSDSWEGSGWERGVLQLVKTEGPVEAWEVLASKRL